MYERVGCGLESPPPDVAQPTSASDMATARSAQSCLPILLCCSRGPIFNSGEVHEERETECQIRLVDGLSSLCGVLKGCGNGYGCFMVSKVPKRKALPE